MRVFVTGHQSALGGICWGCRQISAQVLWACQRNGKPPCSLWPNRMQMTTFALLASIRHLASGAREQAGDVLHKDNEGKEVEGSIASSIIALSIKIAKLHQPLSQARGPTKKYIPPPNANNKPISPIFFAQHILHPSIIWHSCPSEWHRKQPAPPDHSYSSPVSHVKRASVPATCKPKSSPPDSEG
jgi:hypothetical protein